MTETKKNKKIYSFLSMVKYASILLFLVLALSHEALADVRRPFTTRYTNNAHGDIYIVGNVNITSSVNPGGGNNNNFTMIHVDIDANGTTFNSSNASFFLPAGSSVLWAGLYWGADIENADGGVVAPPGGWYPANTQLGQVKFSTGGGYQNINSDIALDFNSANFRYQGFAEVTNLIRTQSAGTSRTYTLADIQAATGTGPSHYAGWSLVVAVEDPNDPLRHFNIFDGFAQVDPATPNVTTTVSGFLTPLSGPFDTHVGMVAYEGDLASSGDFFQINGTSISNGLNPVNNFFNSTITRLGTRISTKNPDYVNQLGFDIDTANYTCTPPAACLISNGDTTANLSFGMTGDWYYPGVLTFAIDIHDPVLQGQVIKSYIDLNGGGINPGDEIEFRIQITNIGDELATNVVMTDPIPPNTTYVPDSMEIIVGPNLGVKTDASGDDQADYNGAAGPNGEVTIRLGTGANATTGGIIGIPGAPDNQTTARFRVTIDGGTADGTPISNAATVDFEDPTGGVFSVVSNIATTVTGVELDLVINKVVDTPVTFEGNTVTFTITATNNGPDQGDNIKITDILPNGFLFSSATPSQGTYSVGSGIWSVGSLANGATATLTIVSVVDTGAALLPQPLINTATMTAVDQPDTDSSNDSDTAAVTVASTSTYSNKYLYLYHSPNPDQMSRTVSVGEPQQAIAGAGGTNTWTLTPALAGDLTLPANSYFLFRIWMYNIVSLNIVPRAFNIRIDSIGTTPMAIGNVNGTTGANSNWNLITLNIPIGGSDITLLAGSQLVMTITNNGGVNMNINIDPDRTGISNSTVGMVVSSLISVDSVEAYTATYPGGVVPGSFNPGNTVFVRTVISDPFGAYDITAARVTILDSIPNAMVTNAAMTLVNTGALTKTYEYQYVIPAGAEVGDWSIQVDADEGTEGIVTDSGFGSFNVGIPDFLIQKTVSVIQDPVNGTTNPKAIPGAYVRYDIKVDNEGAGSADADTVTITDPISSDTEMFVGDFDGFGNAVEFIDGLSYAQRTSGLTLGLIEYDNGVGFGYSPVPDADGFDANVQAVRINFTGIFDGNVSNSPSFTVGFKVRIK